METKFDDQTRRGKFQFSIRSLFLFTLIVALILTSLLMYRRVSEAEEELVQLRLLLAGHLKIEDERLFQAITIPCEEPMTWKWRVYFPKGSKYTWYFTSGNIPQFGLPKSSYSSYTSDSAPYDKGMEMVITISLCKNPNSTVKNWQFSLTRRSANDGYAINGTFSTSVPEKVMDEILRCPTTSTYMFGNTKQETRQRGETIILLRHFIGEKTPRGGWISSPEKPQPGFAVWLEEIK